MSEVPAAQPHVRLRGVCKRFGGVLAVDHVDVDIESGIVHALVGENGAGKSTLGKIVAGVHAPDSGELWVDGRRVHYGAPHDALAHGITMIAQELALVPARSVVENVYLGVESHRAGLVQRRRIRQRYDALCADVGFSLPADRAVGSLSIAEQQKVEILRAIARRARLIVMDEPTAALGPTEIEQLIATIRRLRDRGTTIVYVSHFLEEVLAIADTVTVMRDGRVVRTSPAAGETPATLVTAMLGRRMDQAFPAKVFPDDAAPTVLSVRGLSVAPLVHDVSFDVRAGEIVGLAGLVGSGRSETARAIFGAERLDDGTIHLDGQEIRPSSTREAIDHGIALIPEDRKGQGLLMRRSVIENVTLPHLELVTKGGVVARNLERRRSDAVVESVAIDRAKRAVAVETLSGGNQQKVMFAKWLLARPRVLIADEPTRGVDVGAKRAIYDFLQTLAQEGMAVVVISSDVDEIIGLAHRIVVLRAGRGVDELDGRIATEDDVIHAAFGTSVAA
ncbi:MAG: sugar ABC transporter ATP-binding protein [Solirubrobacterales bacterium]